MEKMIGLVSAVNWALVGGVIVAWSLAPDHRAIWICLGALAMLVFNGLFLASLHDVVHDFALGLLSAIARPDSSAFCTDATLPMPVLAVTQRHSSPISASPCLSTG